MRTGKTLVLEYSFKTLRDHVPVKEVPHHLATLDDINNNLAYRVPMDSSSKESRRAARALLILIGLVVGFLVGVRLVAARRRSRHQQRLKGAAGEYPSSAIAVTDSDEMLQYLLKQSCRCGKRFDLDNESLREETVVYDGSRLTVFRIRCVACNSDRDVYFREPEKAATHTSRAGTTLNS
jgi:hypothetical protein